MSDQIIARVSQSLAKEQSLESLVRQLLEMLEMVTDMESTYLTKVDVEARLQHIMFARNSQNMARFAPPAVRSASGVNARNRSYSCSPD